MAASEYYKIEKLLPYKAKSPGHIYVKDGDLQINLPKDAKTLNSRPISLMKILSNYMSEANTPTSETSLEKKSTQEDVQKDMNEASSSYATMMQIRRELESAYKELMQMQA